MRRAELVHRFDLDDQSVINDQIGAKSGREAHAIKFDIDRLLPVNFVSAPLKGCGEDDFIDAFQQPGPEVLVNPHRCINHVAADGVDVCHTLLLRASAPLRDTFFLAA